MLYVNTYVIDYIRRPTYYIQYCLSGERSCQRTTLSQQFKQCQCMCKIICYLFDMHMHPNEKAHIINHNMSLPPLNGVLLPEEGWEELMGKDILMKVWNMPNLACFSSIILLYHYLLVILNGFQRYCPKQRLVTRSLSAFRERINLMLGMPCALTLTFTAQEMIWILMINILNYYMTL